MKSSKTSRQQQYSNERKNGKRSEKVAKLDRKSSRGMIYENEELRLRTININAEVERGQSDIKRLRRENDQLRREIWTLRDECDRLNKRFKAKLQEHEYGGCNLRGSGGSTGCHLRRSSTGCDGRHSSSHSDDSDSCDTCKGDVDDQCSDDCCVESKSLPLLNVNVSSLESNVETKNLNNEVPKMQSAFDHLSVVSEETLSNSELGQNQNESLLGHQPDTGSSHTTLPSWVGPLTPLTPIELVANQLNDLQAVVPPLSYFENVLHRHQNNGNLSVSQENSRTIKSPVKNAMRHTNGWDYNLESPFAQRKYSSTNTSPSDAPSTPTTTLTTFMSTPPNSTSTPKSTSTTISAPDINSEIKLIASQNSTNPQIETVAITTMPTNNGSGPKHFFSPLKPRLKLNTNLANKNLIAATVPVPPSPTKQHRLQCDPPDICVSNGLATPYHKPSLPQYHDRSNSSQTDSVNLETILNDIETISEDFLAIQLDKNKSRENIPMMNKLSQGESNLQQQEQQQQYGFNGGIIKDNDGGNSHLGSNIMNHRSQHHYDMDACIDENVYDKNKKPYRSEMNLLLSYDGTNPTLIPTMASTGTTMNATNTSSNFNLNSSSYPNVNASDNVNPANDSNFIGNNNGMQNNVLDRRTRSLEREHTESPSPNIPDPMAPFPTKTTYIGFDQLNNAVACAAATAIAGNSQKPPLPPLPSMPIMSTIPSLLSSSGQIASTTTLTVSGIATGLVKPPPPLPPIRLQTSSGSMQNISTKISSNQNALAVSSTQMTLPTPTSTTTTMLASTSASAVTTTVTSMANSINLQKPKSIMTVDKSNLCPGLSPNKSHLYASLAHQAAKRAQFRNPPPHLTRSLDTDIQKHAQEPSASEISVPNSPKTEIDGNELSEALRRKGRRVSIICGDTSSDAFSNPLKNSYGNTMPTIATLTTTSTTTTGSCNDLTMVTALQNPALKHLKPTSYSTPNSPHSSRRQTNSSNHVLTDIPTMSSSTLPSPQQPPIIAKTPAVHQAHQHNRKSSQDSTSGQQPGTSTPTATATVSRAKCSRRHSDTGTLNNSVLRISGVTATNNHHHHHNHHNHHQHQHQHHNFITNPHQSHHLRRDSNQETATSLSDRNSNSFASSRESSTSFSMRSTRRKISISSHTNGKIPWCGCWGNGCL